MKDPDEWLKDGVHYVENTRTKHQMPIEVQFYLDYLQHRGKFNILEQLEDLEQDLFIVHGTEDKVVGMENAEALYGAVPHAVKVEIENANHTFNIAHPLEGKKISLAFAQAVDESIEFFQL
jgi:pimeloyl-ACP methyl ester carboxylesterase